MVFLVVLSCNFFSNGGNAQQTCILPAFSAKNVNIDEIADTGTVARETGISKASAYGFERVLGRLLLEEEDVLELLSRVKSQD